MMLLLASVHSAPLQIIDTDTPAGSGHYHDLIQMHYGGPRYADQNQEPFTLPLFAPIILENYRPDPQLELIGDEIIPSSASPTSTEKTTDTETDWTSTTETESDSTTTPVGMAQGTTVNVDDTDEDDEMPLHHLREKRNRHKIRHTFMSNRYANSYK